MGDRIVVIDAGNTRLKFGLCQSGSRTAGAGVTGGQATSHAGLPALIDVLWMDCGARFPWPQLQHWFNEAGPVAAIVAGSNPPEIERLLADWPRSLAHPRVIRDRTQIPLTIDVDYPDKVGLDRLLGAVAANALRAPDQPAIVVDSGTAVTINAISEHGAFVGGAILPGFELAAKALHEYTALLPLIDAGRLNSTTPPAIGRNTTTALHSGLYWGHVGAVRRVLDEVSSALLLERPPTRPDARPLILLTGGAAHLLETHLPEAHPEPYLPLRGLACVGFQAARQP